MADSFNKTYRYVKGVYEMKAFDPATRDLLYYDNKITENNFQTSTNMGEIAAGPGNPTVIQLPDTAKVQVTLTAADVDLRSRQLQTGGTLAWNGITDVCEVIVATGTSLEVTGTPVAPYGTDVICGYVNGAGTAYTFSGQTLTGFTSTPGTTYSVRYYVSKATNEVLTIQSLFSPQIVSLEVKMPTFAVPDGNAANTGTLVGYWHYIIPRFQFGGDASLSVNQTTPGTSGLSGQALAYNTNSATACVLGNLASLAYMVWEPVNETEGVTGMVVVGGVITMPVSSSKLVPVKYVMEDGSLSQPSLADLTYTVATGGDTYISVTSAGLITSTATEGDTELTISVTDDPTISCVCNVSVTSA